MSFHEIINTIEGIRRDLRQPPATSDDIDPVGPLLRDLDRVVTDLQLVVPARLYGDATLIDMAILGLMLVQRRIQELAAAREAAE